MRASTLLLVIMILFVLLIVGEGSANRSSQAQNAKNDGCVQAQIQCANRALDTRAKDLLNCSELSTRKNVLECRRLIESVSFADLSACKSERELCESGERVEQDPAVSEPAFGPNPELLQKASAGDAAAVRAMLQSGTSPNLRGNFGKTALMVAALLGRVEVIKVLLDAGANLELRDETGATAFLTAAVGRSIPTIDILASAGADIRAADDVGRNAVMKAVLLIDERRGVLTRLLDLGVNVDHRDRAGVTALSQAADLGSLDAIAILLDRGATINTRDDYGQTPLMHTCLENYGSQRWRLKTVRLLMDRGAEINAVDQDGFTALTAALFLDPANDDVVELLLSRGANPNHRDPHGRTPLMIAAHMGNAAAARFLLARGANINTRNNDGQTPLIEACLENYGSQRQRLETVRLLLDRGADVNLVDLKGFTALTATMFLEDPNDDVIELLLARGADPNHKDPHNRTPLMLAAHQGNVTAARMLLARRADVNAKDDAGWTALRHARGANKPAVASLLRSKGAKE